MFIRSSNEEVFLFVLVFGFSIQDFSVALESVLELALVDQAGLELTEIRLPLPPESAGIKGVRPPRSEGFTPHTESLGL